jgi:DNA-binding ferritin-like protein
MKLKLKIKDRIRGHSPRKSGEILEHVFADESMLCVATQDYCRNARGPHLHGLRGLFVAQYRQIEQWLARIVERTQAIGSMARGGLRRLARIARISAPAGAGLAIRTMVVELHALHEELARRLRMDAAICSRGLADTGTASFLGELLNFHEATAGLLQSLLEERHREGV